MNNVTKSLCILIISITNTFGQTPCEQYKKENIRLVGENKNLLGENTKIKGTNGTLKAEKESLTEQLDEAIAVQEKWYNLYTKEAKEKNRFEGLYQQEKAKNEADKKKIEDLNFKISQINEDKNKLNAEITKLKKEGKEKTESYEANMIMLEKKNTEYAKIKKEKEDLDLNYATREEVIIIYEKKVRKLESELKDRISIREKRIYFNDDIYTFGSELCFVIFTKEKDNEFKISEEQQELLRRFSSLIQKFDYKKIKIKLIGESFEVANKVRRELAEQRAIQLKMYLISNYGIDENRFSTDYKSEIGRHGVSVTITY